MNLQICPSCGTENKYAADICRVCGKSIRAEISNSISVFRTAPIFSVSDDDGHSINLLTLSGSEPKGMLEALDSQQIPTTTSITGMESKEALRPLDSDTKHIVIKEEGQDFKVEGVDGKTASKLAERFRPVCPISEGGMGKIFLVQERLSGRYVALKVMLEKVLKDVPLVQQFIREAVICARLQHPNVIPVYDLGFLCGDQLYYTMRYIDGDPFNETIYKVEIDERLRILRSAALAVDYAHSQGLWHRDLKPQNILIGPLGDTYVTDWGLVSIQPNRKYELNLPRILVDRAGCIVPDRLLEETGKAITNEMGVLIGTPAYMAPEQCQGEEFGVVSDIWALGVMFFQALTGRHPLEEYLTNNPIDVMSHVVYDKFPCPSDIVDSIPKELNNLCLRMLTKSIDTRMQNLKEFIEGLSHYLMDRGRLTSTLRTPHLRSSAAPIFDRKSAEQEMLTYSSQRRLGQLETENQMLKDEAQRYQRKIEVLTQLAQLGIFSRRQGKELWAKLAEL